MLPRYDWFMKRIYDCIKELENINKVDDIQEYKIYVTEIAKEILYAVNEWDKSHKLDKYYKD